MKIIHDPLKLLKHQLESLYFLEEEDDLIIDAVYAMVIKKLERLFSCVANKYYNDGSDVLFNPYHSGQYTIFLYIIGNVIYQNNGNHNSLCDKIYGLNKIISSADIFYEVNLPSIWFCDHPQGSVIGRAKFSDFFCFSQGCTVGNNKGQYPVFSDHVSMLSGSKCIGNCIIGDHVIFSANSYVIDRNIPSYSIVFGQGKDIRIIPISLEKYNELTKEVFVT